MDHFNSSVCYNTVGLVYKMGPGTGRLNLPRWISPDVCLIKNPIPDSHQCQTCQRKVRLTKEVSACDLHVCVVVSADSVLHLPVMQSLTCFQIVILYNHNYWRHMANVFHEGVLLKPPRKQTLQKSVTFICEKTHYLNMTDLWMQTNLKQPHPFSASLANSTISSHCTACKSYIHSNQY